MKSFPSLKHAFLMAVSITTFAAAQTSTHGNAVTSDNNIGGGTSMTQDTTAPVTRVAFDYAFGDQAAGAMGLPGCTGKDWSISETLRALEAFNEKNPNALKGKNVMVAIGDCSLMQAVLKGNKLADLFIKSVGNGHIVIMGASEKRTDGLGPMANKKIMKFVNKHKDVVIYGGPMMDAFAPNVKADPKSGDLMRPKTQEEFQFIVERANAALNAALAPTTKIIQASAPRR